MRTLRKHATPPPPTSQPASQLASQPASRLLGATVFLRRRAEPFFPLALCRGERTRTLVCARARTRACICVHARTVQKNNKDTRHNEELRAPRLGDNYREPTLQPSKGSNVKCYTSRHHHGSFYGNARATFAPPTPPPPPARASRGSVRGIEINSEGEDSRGS